ncbi:MAG: hypothetical protein AAB554_04665 [Patescibacteria group bacterium]
MPFSFAWEQPAAAIGALAVISAAAAAVIGVVRTHHGPSRVELLALGFLAAVGVWTWDARLALAKRWFPDGSGVVEEDVAYHVLQYGDCAAYVAATGRGEDDGATCRLRVFASYGRHVSDAVPAAGAESPCDVIASPEIRAWTFARGSVRDRCAE